MKSSKNISPYKEYSVFLKISRPPVLLSSFCVGIKAFLLGSTLTAALCFIFSRYITIAKKINEDDSSLNQSLSMDKNGYTSNTKNVSLKCSDAKKCRLSAEIREEQLSRNLLYFGDDGMKSISNASILIVGIGGVGSHAAHMLARSGVRYIRLVDFDKITLSSLDRQACATLKDVGFSKVNALKRYLEKICPDSTMMEIDARVRVFTGDPKQDDDFMSLHPYSVNSSIKSEKSWDIVIDAVSDVDTKSRLLDHCVRNKIRAISCICPGRKSDMTRLHISDLQGASCDPVINKIRNKLKNASEKNTLQGGISFMDNMNQIAVLYSSEKKLPYLNNCGERRNGICFQKGIPLSTLRISVLPVFGIMSAIMGESLAALAICELGNKPFSPFRGKRLGRNVRQKIFRNLKNRERQIRDKIESSIERYDLCYDKMNSDITVPRVINNKWVGPVQIDIDDLAYLLTQIWGSRCCVTGECVETVLELVRWDLTKPSNSENLVLLGSAALKKFEEAALVDDGRNSIPISIQKKIEACLQAFRNECII